ncbi:alpha/beta fold hydrolase [Mucilaginibacter sp.]|uniref:alpha/beta hydrolase family protein n=1 Tax=Mucilaginibacter sp. TaxID=1882438 RepID=UPI00284C788D|nr:alpha/beta fold hydrolase [Mucilaginibacter sp.]MDR3694457.1 alpha/beta fold hydrolase [Mucilaginibacter sp.]
MKKLLIVALAVCFTGQLKAQDVTGSWVGAISVRGVKLHLVFNIKKTSDTSYSSTFDSPDQKAFGIACSSTFVKKDSLFIGMAIIKGGYKGILAGHDSVSGVFTQGPAKFPLGIKKITDAEKASLSADKVRPQTPKQPYGYHSEDVEYDNADKSLHYGATFTRPDGDGKYPAVIIISGSGTQDRNGTMLGHQPYWVLADYLTKNGIAVLRVDDRGAGKSSLGTDTNNKTSVDFSYDVEASLNYLETRTDVDKKHLGLIGHSEGGMIAPMVAARRNDVAFIVLWGGPGVNGAKILTEQSALALKEKGMDSVSVAAYKKLHFSILSLFAMSATKADLDQQIPPVVEAWKKEQTQKTLDALNVPNATMEDIEKVYDGMYSSGWLRFFISYDPATALSKVKCPVLAVTGEKDTQVDAAENLGRIKDVLTKSGNKDFEVKTIPGLNHLFQTAHTGDVSEYEQISETMSPVAMNIICSWIKIHVK